MNFPQLKKIWFDNKPDKSKKSNKPKEVKRKRNRLWFVPI